MYIPREALLEYQTKSKSDRTPLVLIYHPHLKPINKIVKNLQPLLNKDPHLNQIFSTPPLISYRQPANLNFYSHLPPYQMNISSRAPFPVNLLNAISAPT